MMNTKVYLIALCIFIYLKGFTQGFGTSAPVPIPPSPNASSLMEYVNVPVDLSTGVAQVSVPLFDLKARTKSVPISLSYHASGIKVQDVASQVGLGWALNAGGVITRVVRGRADGNGFCENYYDKQSYYSMLYRLCDSEPDIYYFNFMGKTGRFVLSKDGIPTLLPYQNLKISPAVGVLAQPFWTITDENGYKYTFGETNNEIEYTISESMFNGAYTDPSAYDEAFALAQNGSVKKFVSSWYLSKVIDPNGNVEFNFQYTYVPNQNITYQYYAQTLSALIGTAGSCPSITNTYKNTNTKIIIENPKYLSSITSNLGSANFYYIGNRKDLVNGKFLSRVLINSATGAAVKDYSFNYEYFNGARSSGGFVVGPGFTFSYPDNCADCFRLKLKSITDGSIVLREFSYIESVDLPKRSGVFEDHWGFFNGYPGMYSNDPDYNWQQNKVPRIPDVGINFGSKKNSYFLSAQANSLQFIKYPTGGTTELVYSDNGVGLRIDKIIDRASTNSISNTREFIYGQKYTYSEPVYYYKTKSSYQSTQASWSATLPGFNISFSYDCTADFYLIHSSAYNNLFDLNGSAVNYGTVTVLKNSVEKEDYYYTNFIDHPDTAPVVSNEVASAGDVLWPGLSTDPNGPPFAPYSTKFWERGLLTSKVSFIKSGVNFLVAKEENYLYDFYQPIVREVEGVSVISVISTTDLINHVSHPVYTLGRYKYVSRPLLSTGVITEIFDQQDPGNGYKRARSSTQYDYVPIDPPGQTTIASDLMPRRITFTSPDGDKIITDNKYVADYANVNYSASSDAAARGIYALKNKKIDNAIIESISYIEKTEGGSLYRYLISGKINSYMEFDGAGGVKNVFPWISYKLKVSNSSFSAYPWSSILSGAAFINSGNYKPNQTFTSYDFSGNPLAAIDQNGITYNYSWMNSSLLTSQVVNPSTNSALQYQTNYAHQPLVGLTTVTDQNSIKTNYIYDSKQRLKLITDNKNNITQRFRYHYKDEIDFKIDFSISGAPTTGNDVTFSSTTDTEQLGNTSYMWDFGDGQVIENGTKSTSHSYSNPGTYTVKLFKVNPEYDKITLSKSITIYDPPSVSISSSSSSVDLCSSVTSATLTANGNGGCPGAVTYNWYYSTGSTWTFLGAGSVQDFSMGLGSYSIKCVLTDFCGQSSGDSNIESVNFYMSTNNCPIR